METKEKSFTYLFQLCVCVFLDCLTVGISLGTLPTFVHQTLHYNNLMVGLVIGIQSAVTLTRRIIFENAFSTTLVGFITRKPSKEYTQALEPTTLLYITRDDFYTLLKDVPEWEKFYRLYLEYAYVNNTNRLMSFITLDASERYRQLLEENPEIVLRLPNRIVASYLNVSPETLSRLKSKKN